jgi:hypothetical protein
MSPVVDRLAKLNENCKFIDSDRLQDTLEMVADESDPHGFHFLSLFLQECYSDLHLLATHLGDRPLTARTAHRWAGRCAQLGAVRMEGAGRKLQALAGGATEHELKEVVDKMEEDLRKMESFLKDYDNIVLH